MSTVTAGLVAVADFTSHSWIGDIDVPVSVLVTMKDSVVPPGRQMKLADAIRHATVVTVEDDHGVFIASPRLFTEKMLEACQAGGEGRPTEKIVAFFLGVLFGSSQVQDGQSADRPRRGWPTVSLPADAPVAAQRPTSSTPTPRTKSTPPAERVRLPLKPPGTEPGSASTGAQRSRSR